MDKMFHNKTCTTNLIFGSLPSLVYCQQIRPIRSWTLAVAVTIIGMGYDLSEAGAIVR